MVDADRAGMRHQVAQGGRHSGAISLAQGHGREWAKPPVLSERIERIRRAADMRTPDHRFRRCPGVRTVWRGAHRQVEIEADPHAGCACAPLGVRELAIGDPLQPLVE
jgi:hypothetical protein